MKAIQMEISRMEANERRNRKHVQSLMSGWSYKRFSQWLTFELLLGAMAAYGHVRVCRMVKDAGNEQEFAEAMRKAA